MLFLAAACITIAGETAAGLAAGGSAATPTPDRPMATPTCMAAPIPYSARSR